MTIQPEPVDPKRSAGWLPEQDELEAWLDGHRERVQADSEQLALHPVIEEFRELVDTDPTVRMYLNQMIDQVPSTKPYRKRHLESVEQMLLFINALLTMAPEFGESSMVATPLAAIFDWSMGTPAGFAAFRDPRVNAMLKKVLGAWCEFLAARTRSTCSTIRRRVGRAPRPSARSAWTSTSTTLRPNTGALRHGTISSPGASRRASVPWPRRRTTR